MPSEYGKLADFAATTGPSIFAGRLWDLRKPYLVAGLIYPVWHLLAPPSAVDPWWLWWLISGCYLVAALVCRALPAARPYASLADLGFSCAASLHIFALAAVNGMHPFYAVGSVMAGVMVAAVMPSLRAMRFYFSALAIHCTVLALLYPHPLMAAYWLPIAQVGLLLYYRLKLQSDSRIQAQAHQTALERAVEERTRDLTRRTEELSAVNQRLRTEMAERLRLEERLAVTEKMEALGRLAGGVAHDFNNVVTAICGYADFALAELKRGEPAAADVEQIKRSAQRAAELVNQLLAFSRRSAAELEVLDLGAIVADMRSIFRAVLPENVALKMEAGASVHMEANRSQIEQVILNLAMNARDAMPEGGALVVEVLELDASDTRIVSLVDEPKGRYAFLSFTDTGVGMDEETRARVFDPFFTTKPVNEGTGLGLSIVHGIVTQSHGHLSLHSEVGAGTSLEIAWPAVEAVAEDAAGVATGTTRGSERVLVVEDEREVRQLVRRMLVQDGYDVLDAEDPEVALRIASDEPGKIDLLVTDVVMPKMSGFELAEQLCEQRPETRVIFISGHLDHPSLREGEIPPGAAFVPKPFGPAKLARTVREVLDQTQPQS